MSGPDANFFCSAGWTPLPPSCGRGGWWKAAPAHIFTSLRVDPTRDAWRLPLALYRHDLLANDAAVTSKLREAADLGKGSDKHEGDFWRHPEDARDFTTQPPTKPADEFVLKFRKPQ
jgi:hypothetical protein